MLPKVDAGVAVPFVPLAVVIAVDAVVAVFVVAVFVDENGAHPGLIKMPFVAVHEFANGTSPHKQTPGIYDRFWGSADMGHRPVPIGCDAHDPGCSLFPGVGSSSP